MKIPNGAIKIALPKVFQHTAYTCGPAAFQSIFTYYKTHPNTEFELMKLLKTTYLYGTCPKKMLYFAKKMGFYVNYQKKMTIDDLKRYLNRRIPVICDIQAWGSRSAYQRLMSGHYIIAIGYDEERIYFEDPSIIHHRRGFLSYQELEDRWYDINENGKILDHLGIAIWKRKFKPYKKLRKASLIQ